MSDHEQDHEQEQKRDPYSSDYTTPQQTREEELEDDINVQAADQILGGDDDFEVDEYVSDNMENVEQGGDVDADDIVDDQTDVVEVDVGDPSTPEKVEETKEVQEKQEEEAQTQKQEEEEPHTRFAALSVDDGGAPSQRPRKISIHGLARRRSQSKLDIAEEHLTTATFDWFKNLVWAVIRLFIFFCTSIILTTLVGNYTNVDLGCYFEGRMFYITRTGGWKFNAVENQCDGNQDFILLYYHLGNIMFFLMCVMVLVDCVAPGPWHRPSLGYTFRQISLKFRTWEQDHVGIHFVRFIAHLLVVCYGNCDIVDENRLSDDDYFVYFQELLEEYDYIHFSMFLVAIFVFLICVGEEYLDWKMLIWWNTPTEQMTEVHHTNSYQKLWPHYYEKYRFHHDEDANALWRYLDLAFTFKGYLWFISFSLTWVLSLFFSVYHLYNVNTESECKGTKFGKMSFVFVAQILVLLVVYVHLLHSRYWQNQAGGVDGRSWMLMFWLIMMGYCAVEPKYPVDYTTLSEDAIDNLRIIICWSGLVTMGLGVFNTIVHKAYFPMTDLMHAPVAVLHFLEHLFFQGGLMILSCVLILMSLGQYPLISEGIVFIFRCKDDARNAGTCTDGTVTDMTFRGNNILTILILIPMATIFVFVLFTFWDRTKKIGKDRVVPFHQFGLWFFGFLCFIILNASSYRALDATADFYSDVLDYAWDSDTQPTKVETSNGYTAAENVHFFITCGLVLLWFFYTVSFCLQWSLVQEYRSKMPEEANQLFAGWLVPLGISIISLLYSCVTVYYNVNFVVHDKKFEIPAGLRDLFISGPIFTALIILYAAMISALRSHVLTPVSRKTVGVVGFATLFSSVCYVLMSVEMLDDFVNRGGNFRVHIDGFMQLFVCYLLTFVALLLIIVDDTAEALPLYQFQKLSEDNMVYHDHDLYHERYGGVQNN